MSPSSASTITSDLKNIQTQLAVLKGQGGGAFANQANELSASVNQIQKAAGELSSNPSAAIKDLTTALTSLKAKSGAFISEMNSVCPKA